MASRADIKAGRAYVELFLKNSKFVRGLQSASKQLHKFGDDAMRTGRQLAMAGSLMLIPIALATSQFAKFDDEMRVVKAVTQATSAEFAALTADAKRLGATTSFTATQVAELKSELGRAGFSPDQINNMTQAVLNLARATKTEGAQSAGIMAATIRQFNLEAGDSARVADALTAAANKSFNTLESLGESLSYAGPVAADLNLSLEDTLAILGGLGNIGIQGSAAGTALRRISLTAASEAEKIQKIFGVAAVDAAGNALPLVDVLDRINASTKNLGTAERAKLFNEAFGLRGITGASGIGKSAVSIRELANAIKDAGGLAQKTADDMDAGLGGAMRILTSAVEGVSLAIGEALEGPLTGLIRLVTEAAGQVREFVEANHELVQLIAVVGATLAVVGGVLIAVGVAAKSAAFVIGGLAIAMSSLSLIFTAVAGSMLSPFSMIVRALILWVRYTDSGKAAIKGLVNLFVDLAKTAKTAIGGIANALSQGDLETAGRIAILALKVGVLQALDSLPPGVVGAFSFAFGSIKQMLEQLVSVFNKAAAWIEGLWGDMSSGMGSSFANAAKFAVDVWQDATSQIANAILDDAANGGIVGRLALAGSGVDVEAESQRGGLLDRERRQLLKKRETELRGNLASAEAGDGTFTDIGGTTHTVEDLRRQIADTQEALGVPIIGFLDAAKRDAEGQLASTGEQIKNKIDDLDAAAQETFAGFEVRGREVQSTAGSALAEAQAELDRLSKRAKEKADEDRKKREGEEDGGGGGGLPAPIGGGAAARIFGSFSASAITAAGGQSLQQRVAKGIEKLVEKAEEQTRQTDRVIGVIRDAGGIV